MTANLSRRVVAEFLGTAFLVAAVVGSGIMAERLAGGNVAIALLANTIATGAALAALILTFGPISGAHLNPAVSITDILERGLQWHEGAAYIAAQVAGGVAGRDRGAHNVWVASRVSVAARAKWRATGFQ
jgi:glycerol uptake facilitator-like aquaporin